MHLRVRWVLETPPVAGTTTEKVVSTLVGVYISVCLPVCLSACLYVCLLSIVYCLLSVVFLSVCMFVSLSICLSVCCLLSVVCCLLSVVCCLLSVSVCLSVCARYCHKTLQVCSWLKHGWNVGSDPRVMWSVFCKLTLKERYRQVQFIKIRTN